MAISTSGRVLSKIYGKRRGWAFSIIDFTAFGSRSAIDVALHRLLKNGTIRRVIRGIYDYPRYSDMLKTELSPDIDQVAQALARKFGWRVQPSGSAALNLLGLSTQVPSRMVYLSDGPNRSYNIATHTITFKHTALKEARLRVRESTLIVQALKSLGPQRTTPEVIAKIRRQLDPKLHAKVLKDTKTATGWAYETIRGICSEDV